MNMFYHYEVDSHCDWQVTDQFLCGLNYFAKIHANLCSFHVSDLLTVAVLYFSFLQADHAFNVWPCVESRKTLLFLFLLVLLPLSTPQFQT